MQHSPRFSFKSLCLKYVWWMKEWTNIWRYLKLNPWSVSLSGGDLQYHVQLQQGGLDSTSQDGRGEKNHIQVTLCCTAFAQFNYCVIIICTYYKNKWLSSGIRSRRIGAQPVVSSWDGRERHGTGLWTGTHNHTRTHTHTLSCIPCKNNHWGNVFPNLILILTLTLKPSLYFY